MLEVISGRRRGFVASLLRLMLGTLTPLYRLAIWWRNRKFDRAIACANGNTQARDSIVRKVSVPVVSIGNLTTGGTGKTPLVVAVAKVLRTQGRRVALVSRGYGADLEKDSRNDEAMELEYRLPDVPHLQDPDRFEMARIAIEELETEVIVLDDGFQHRQLHRDLDIVTVDATNPFGYGRLLPRGLLREPIASLERADLVVITRTNLVPSIEIDKILKRLTPYMEKKDVLISSMDLVKAIQASGRETLLEDLRGTPTFLFSGIGNPAGFEAAINKKEIVVVGHDINDDHHSFGREDIHRIGQLAMDAGAKQIICTHKDLVKVRVDQIAGLSVFAVLVEVNLSEGQERLESALGKLDF